MPPWLIILAIASLASGVVSAVWIGIDIFCGRRQPMWIMNIVWPVSGLYAGPLALWAWYSFGRDPDRTHLKWQGIALGVSHCGSGCTLGDLVVEGSLILLPPVMLFGHEMFAAWALDYCAAFIIGIAFQYFTIKPMGDKTSAQALWAAVKADTLSLTSWQIGMYGWMAIATFAIFSHPLNKTGPVFWFMMQIAMLFGFATAWPVNTWLIRKGIKETM